KDQERPGGAVADAHQRQAGQGQGRQEVCAEEARIDDGGGQEQQTTDHAGGETEREDSEHGVTAGRKSTPSARCAWPGSRRSCRAWRWWCRCCRACAHRGWSCTCASLPE